MDHALTCPTRDRVAKPRVGRRRRSGDRIRMVAEPAQGMEDSTDRILISGLGYFIRILETDKYPIY